MKHIVNLTDSKWRCKNCELLISDSDGGSECKDTKKCITLTITRNAVINRNPYYMAKEWGEYYGYQVGGKYRVEQEFDDNGELLDHYDRIYFEMIPA